MGEKVVLRFADNSSLHELYQWAILPSQAHCLLLLITCKIYAMLENGLLF